MFGLLARYYTVIAQADVRCHELHELNHINRDKATRAQHFIQRQTTTDPLSRPAPILPQTLALQKFTAHDAARSLGPSTSRGRGGGGGGGHRAGRKRRFPGGGSHSGGGGGQQQKKW